MVECPICHREVSRGAGLCPHCGSLLPDDVEELEPVPA